MVTCDSSCSLDITGVCCPSHNKCIESKRNATSVELLEVFLKKHNDVDKNLKHFIFIVYNCIYIA